MTYALILEQKGQELLPYENLIMEDFNANIGQVRTGAVVSKFGLGIRNDQEDRLVEEERWLQRGSMFVISQAQFRKLLKVDNNWSSMSLLDLGAGDGEVTSHIAPLFKNVFTTELSSTMRTLLQRRGYKVLDIETWHSNKYNVIACLNLIDRCDTPLELMDQIKNCLEPDGRVLVAVVLPFSAYVESAYPHHKPKELLPINGTYFEEQISSVVMDFLVPAGFEVVTWSRVPYLCEGDLQQSYYWLDDAIFVLKLRNA